MEPSDLFLSALTVAAGIWLLSNLATPNTTGGGSILSPISDLAVNAIAEAIAVAEGFYVAGSIPQRANNPGDLMMGDVLPGMPTQGTLGAGIVVFVNLTDGWTALKHKVGNMLGGNSRVYQPDMTIAQVASKYTATQQTEWANNVAGGLGVTPDTTLADVAALHS